MTRRPPKPASRWRESTVLATAERAKHRARRYGLTLEVTLTEGGVVRVTAGRYVASAGRFTVLDRFEWGTVSQRLNVEATIAVAKRWAENAADRLAGKAGAP